MLVQPAFFFFFPTNLFARVTSGQPFSQKWSKITHLNLNENFFSTHGKLRFTACLPPIIEFRFWSFGMLVCAWQEA